MKVLKEMLLAGPVLVGEVRGAKAETSKRFDKSEKNAPPIVYDVFKLQMELLGDGTPFILTVFLERGTDPELYAQSTSLKRGDIIAVAVRKLEHKNHVSRASCGPQALRYLSPEEVLALRS